MFEQLRQAVNAITPMSNDDWDIFEPLLQLKSIKKNDFFLKMDEVERYIGFVNKGSFRWYYINGKGEEVNYHFFFDNDFVVGFDSFITQTPSRLFIQAMEDTELVLLPERSKILEFYSKSHTWEHFGRLISEGVYAQTAARVHDFLFNSAEERYLSLLKQYPNIFQRVSLSNIASYLGVQGPSLSRIRKRISKS